MTLGDSRLLRSAALAARFLCSLAIFGSKTVNNHISAPKIANKQENHGMHRPGLPEREQSLKPSDATADNTQAGTDRAW
jgi:hypothetical protein